MSTNKKSEQKSTEISRVEFSNDELLNISSFQDAVALLESKGADITLAHEVIGNGFALLDDKKKLVDVPFLILQWRFLAGNFGEYVNMLVITQKNEKYIVSDGSGMPEQMREFTARTGQTAGMAVLHGLTVSEYEFCQICRTSKPEFECADYDAHRKSKDVTPASSFYLNLTA